MIIILKDPPPKFEHLKDFVFKVLVADGKRYKLFDYKNVAYFWVEISRTEPFILQFPPDWIDFSDDEE
jgi:hypothetical protein